MKVLFEFIEDDGGRAAAGYRGSAGDCACRAIAIATESDYQDIYDLIKDYGKTKERRGKRKRDISHPRTGVWRPAMHHILEKEFGFIWTPTMHIGSGCKVHVRPDELPGGRLILSLSKHYVAFIDGVLRDTYDCSRGGTRCVYGYWKAP